MAERMWFFSCSLFLLFGSGFAANAAWRKNITAQRSCGENKTDLYYHISMITLLPFLRNMSKCDQSDPKFAHPPKAMVDGKLYTNWLSEPSRDDARITIDLSGSHQKFYYVESINISFGDNYPPARIAFSKKSSNNASKNFAPWHYMVTESENCKNKFGTKYQEIPAVPNSILCSKYGTKALGIQENVIVHLQGGRGVVVDDTGKENTQLLDWMKTTAVEIRFSGLHLLLDNLAYRWEYYVVNEIEISAYCECNGHADGINCPYDNSIGDRKCLCQEGTCGINCEACCPAYNQYPYKKGAKGPFNQDENAACQKCNCHNHADSCFYNETIANNTCPYDNNATNDDCSMDTNGIYNGGGVCDNCKDNTEGINCQRCITSYYRESGKSQWDKDACQACNCFQNGTKNITRNGVQYLDCVRDDEEATKLINLNPGDCLCKNKTTGRRCDHCQDGYYNLTAENLEGCQACHCNTNGTVNGTVKCDDNGDCFCKEHVRGDKCSYCESGTFNLVSANQHGCTKCICSGITKNCSSSSDYKDMTTYSVKGWKLTHGLNSSNMLPVISIKEDVNGQSIDMISANVSTGQSLYWMAGEKYFGENSLVGAYGGELTFTRKVSSVPNGTVEKNPQVVLKGPRNVTIKHFLPSLVPGLLDPVLLSVKMVEFNWTHFDTAERVNRSSFMLVLAKLNEMWITASYFTSGPGTYQTSFGNVQIGSVSNHSNGNGLAVDVEQCSSCGEAYAGSSCERCARGHHRVNVSGHFFFGVCVSCNCHGHTPDCDSDTGECLNCQHNTTGFNCELCEPSFYGDARNGTSDDCQKCPCQPPRTTTKLCSLLRNGSVQCLNCSQGYEKNLQCNRCEFGYFGRPDLPGGNCSSCQCNNNSDICDRETGSCPPYCKNNSTGWHCERCENGTYGDATKQQCQACTCNVTGSYDQPCDHSTGQCPCKPNVQGFNCSSCAVNSYGFNDSGCQQCGCNEFGSVSLQCNESGICECKNFTRRNKCDACVDYYYGLPNATCNECACNSTGSNGTICDHENGQCPCKIGVDGRRCERCKKQHKHFSDQGCESCPRCTNKLQNGVDEAASTLSRSKKEAAQADQSINMVSILEDLEKRIPGVLALQEKHTRTAESLAEYSKRFSNNTLNSTLMDLNEREKKLKIQTDNLVGILSKELERIGEIRNLSSDVLGHAQLVNQTTQGVVQKMREMLAEAVAMNESSSRAVLLINQSIPEALFQQEREKNISHLAEQSLKITEEAANKIPIQMEKIKKLREEINQFNSELNSTRGQIEKERITMDKTQSDVEEIKRLIAEVDRMINKTEETLKQTSLNFNESLKLRSEGEDNYNKVQHERLPELLQEIEKLKDDLNDVNSSLEAVADVISNASQHAQDLKYEAEQLNKNFSEARRHGEKAVATIEQYDELTRKINKSLGLSKQANRTVNELLSRIRNLSDTSQDLNGRILESYNKSSILLAATKERNLNLSELTNGISQAHKTSSEANETCRRVEVSENIFRVKSSEIGKESASIINAELRNSSKLALETLNLSKVVEMETKQLKKRLAVANHTLAGVNALVVNASDLMQESNRTVIQTGKLLSNLSENINATKQLLREIHQTQKNVTARMAILKEKLKSAKEKVAKFRHAMQLKGNTSVQLQLTNRTISNPLLTAISLDFKTNFSSGLLLYMAPNNNTNQSVSLKLIADRVRFTYNLGGPPVVITNWDVAVADNTWHRIYATRYCEKARLTVTNLQNGLSRTYEPRMRYPPLCLEMRFNKDSPIFLGGLPTNEKLNFTYFDGMFDNFVLNEEEVAIWKPVSVKGERRFAAKRVQPNDFGFCVTFHGNGFIQQLAGNLKTSVNSSLQFQFRSFFKNAILVRVEGTNKEFIYEASLNNGHIVFQYNASFINVPSVNVSSQNSHYNDGQWHNVYITRTLKNASLLVTSLSSNEEDDYVTTSRGFAIYLPSAKYVYFGGTSENSDRNFAGGMKLVSLSSMIQNNPVRRDLDDKNVTVQSIGVSFDECIKMVEKGLRYFNGYTALKTENIENIAWFSIRFKTTEPSGLLAYSVKQEIGFYLALFHGNLFMVYGNATENYVTLQTSTETLNDGAYHIAEIQISNSRIQMKVETSTETISKTLPSDLPAPILLDNVLFIAGVNLSTQIHLQVPILKSFNGDIKSVIINQNTILDGSSPKVFVSAVSKRVSAAGVSLADIVKPTPAPTYPPACGEKYNETTRSEKHEEVHFQGIDSVLGLSPSKSLLNSTSSSFVISVEFRALSPNGILLLTMDNYTNPSQFVSLELVDGNLVYQFNTGKGLVKMRSQGNYAVGGVWYKVHLLRIGQFGAIVVPKSKEYHKDTRDGPTERLVINSIYVGGIIADANTSMLKNPDAPSFFGCIRELTIQTVSANKTFNLSAEAVVKRNVQKGMCYDFVQPQVGFDGAGYAKLAGTYNLSTGSELSIRFRTTERNGLLFFAMDEHKKNTMKVELVKGQVIVSYIHSTLGTITLMSRTDPNITSPLKVNSSYGLCDNIYHTITITRTNGIVELIVDSKNAVNVNNTDVEILGTVYIGGVSSDLHDQVSSTGKSLVGCVESVIINGHVVDFRHGIDKQKSVEFGCRAPIKPQESYSNFNILKVFTLI